MWSCSDSGSGSPGIHSWVWELGGWTGLPVMISMGLTGVTRATLFQNQVTISPEAKSHGNSSTLSSLYCLQVPEETPGKCDHHSPLGLYSQAQGHKSSASNLLPFWSS